MSEVITKVYPLEIKKARYGYKNIYVVKNEAGEILYSSDATVREYVAIAGFKDQAEHRFGRLDLIGRGSSSYNWEGGRYDWIAVLPDFTSLVHPLPRKEETVFTFKTIKGKKQILHYDAEMARKKLHSMLKRAGVRTHISSITLI